MSEPTDEMSELMDEVPVLPPISASAADWRARIADAPGKDLLKMIQRDPQRASRLTQGFRPSAEAVKNPVVLSRVAEEAAKQPGFAQELAEALGVALSPFPPSEGEKGESERTKFFSTEGTPGAKGKRQVPNAFTSGVPSVEKNFVLSDSPFSPSEGGKGLGDRGGAGTERDTRLREQIEKQRASLKEKEDRVAALEREAAQTKRDLAQLRADLEAARRLKDAAETEGINLRRRAERDAKRLQAAETQIAQTAATPAVSVAAPVSTPSPSPTSLPFEEALRRLLRRGKYAAVAEVCKEAILGGGMKEAPATARGAIHALYAAALYGGDECDRAADQDQRAVDAFLSGGAVLEACESLVRIFSQKTLLRTQVTEEATHLKLLIALADKYGQMAAVTAMFLRLRIVSPEGFRLLLASLNRRAGKRGAEIAAALATTAREQSDTGGIGADEMVALPGTALPALSPRKLVEAAQSGEGRLVLRVRDVLAQMRVSGDPKQATLADALLAAVGDLSRVAVIPFTTAPGTSLRPAVVDASNVARHNPDPLALDNNPRLQSLLLMRDELMRRQFFPVLLVADATLRFHMDDKAAYVALVERGMVRETPPGTSADETLIAETREREATLVSNDRLSDWGDAARRIERLGFTLSHTGINLFAQ